MLSELAILFIISCLFVVFSLSIKAEKCRHHAENIYLLPGFLLLFSALGSWLTVGFPGIISILSIPCLFWFYKLYAKKVYFYIPKSELFLLLGLISLCFGLQVFLLADVSNHSFRTVHADDYSYIHLSGLLQFTGKESLFTELNRILFNLDFKYLPYHYFEFYILSIIQRITGFSNFLVFEFFIIPVAEVLALWQLYRFIQNRWPQSSFLVVVGLALILFSSLRFNFLDEKLNQIIPMGYWNKVFFKNYPYQHPLSFFFGYKLCLGVVFLLPLIQAFREKENWSHWLFQAVLTGIISVANLPFVGGLLAVKWLSSRLSYANILVISLIIIVIVLPLNISYPQGWSYQMGNIYPKLQANTNLIFENYYWTMLPVFLLILVLGRQQYRWLLLPLALFPLIFIQHQIGFKVFLVYILCLFAFYIWWFRLSGSGKLFGEPFLVLAGLHFFAQYFEFIPDFNQVSLNLFYLVLVVFLLDMLIEFKVQLTSLTAVLLLLVVIFVNIPSVIADRQMPLRNGKIPEVPFFEESQRSGKPVKALYIVRFRHLPFIFHTIPGNEFLQRYNHIFISPAGIEQLTDTNIQLLKNTGFWYIALRNPYFEFAQNRKKEPAENLYDFVKQHQIQALFVENQPQFEYWLERIKPWIKETYLLENKETKLFILNSARP